MKTRQVSAKARKAVTPGPRVRVKLESLIDCRRELARLYREARGGRVSTQDVCRLANVLQILAGIIRGIGELDSPLSELERANLIVAAMGEHVDAAEAVSDTADYAPPTAPAA